jgi:hypothetical protein
MSKIISLLLVILLLATAAPVKGHGGPLSDFLEDPTFTTSAKEIGADDTEFTSEMLTPQPGDTGVYGGDAGPSPITVKNLDPLMDHEVGGRQAAWKYNDECRINDGAIVRVVGTHQNQVLVEVLGNSDGPIPSLYIPNRLLCPDSIIFFLTTEQFYPMRLRWLNIVEQREAESAAAAEKIIAEQRELDSKARALADEQKMVRDLLAQRSKK